MIVSLVGDLPPDLPDDFLGVYYVSPADKDNQILSVVQQALDLLRSLLAREFFI